MSLFASIEASHLDDAKPLAARMRPRTLDEFFGQSHVLGEGTLLRRMLLADRIQSVVFYGPPGVGKTTLAELIAKSSQRRFVALNAAATGVKELREALDDARQRLESGGGKTLLFVDELHHFNKQQQNVLLPDVEQGVVSLVAATTANPFFALIAPLLSRSQIFELKPLSADEIKAVVQQALADRDRGYGQRKLDVPDDVLDFLAASSDGDARRALGALEIAVESLGPSQRALTIEIAQESLQKKAIRYDKSGDDHYDVISAFIKSMRGSDADATIYWLARMLEAGEEPRFIARRIVIAASEDVGLADPQALVVAMAAAQALEMIGLPEGRIPLAQAALYVAMAPKSNASYNAINEALGDIRKQYILPVPNHLRDGHYPGAKRLGHGEGYIYPHDAPGGWVKQ
ncbi:MAG: AAA family ATPase, partial [Planctomyces sp.]|nr:AAA family ATPase [Planctomyces sp.]